MAILYPKKNIIPDFNDPGWFQDSTIAGGTMTVDQGDPYKATFNISTSGQARVIQIPVEKGQTYYFSSRVMEGLFRIYKRKVTYHVDTLWITKGTTVSFTVDDSFEGYITIRLTNSVTGNVRFENLQLEPGDRPTAFEPLSYTASKPLNNPVEIINPDMSGAAGHGFMYGNVIGVKNRVALNKSLINVSGVTGAFNIAIYEWVDGVGVVGNPLFKKDTTYTTQGLYTYSFEGVILEPGKKYWIGRYDPDRTNSNTGQAYVDRKTSMPGTEYKDIVTYGGCWMGETTVTYSSTYYYFFALEVESMYNKPAATVPHKNLIPSFNDPAWFQFGTPVLAVDPANPHKASITLSTNAGHAYMIHIPVEVGKQYTFSFKSMTGLYRLYKTRVYNHDVPTLLANDANPGKPDTYTFTPDASYQGFITVRLTHSVIGTWQFENLQLEEGSARTYFVPYKSGNKKAAIVVDQTPGRNLVPPLSDPAWFVKFGQSKGVIVNEYEYFMSIGVVGVVGYDIPITLKPNTTYTLGGTFIGTGARLRLMKASDDTFLVNLNPSTPIQTYTTTSLTDYKIRIENNGQAGDYTSKDYYIYEGNIANPVFTPALRDNKPAQLYPAKNFLLPFSEWVMDAQANAIYEYTDRNLIIKFNADTIYKGLRMPIDMNIFNLLRGKTVTLSTSYTLREAAATQVQLRFSGGAGGNLDFVIASNAGAAVAVTKTVPTDFTSVSMVVQTNIIGQTQIEVKELQLEIGDKATAWNKYNLGNR